MPPPTLAVDFGTSNTAAAMLEGGAVRRLPLEGTHDTLPTAVFLPQDGGPMRIGRAAESALIAGDDGRYMRALKSVLGTPLFHDPRLIAGRRRTLHAIVTDLLTHLKNRAETIAETQFSRVLSGRPVHFHSKDAARDAQAQADLRACYHAAGFDTVDFLPEPEAAALASGNADRQETRLIVDIGGGTSDFSVVTAGPGGVRVHASHGIRLGGTDFDQMLSMAAAMPHLGLDVPLRRTLGDGLLPMPRGLFADLATWPMIPFLYTPETLRAVADLHRHATDPAPLERLRRVISDRLGHDLAFAVERAKIAANGADPAAAIDMGLIDAGLAPAVSPGTLAAALAPCRDRLRTAMLETLFRAGTPPTEIQAVVLVGGSSLMALIGDESRAVCPAARMVRTNAFTAVVDGLALATA